MKVDSDFIRQILLAMEDEDDYLISSHHLMQKLNIKGHDLERKFMGHILILADKDLIESFSSKYPFGFVYCVGGEYSIIDVGNRLTARGYELIDILKNEKLFNKVKDYTLSNAFDIAKQILLNKVK